MAAASVSLAVVQEVFQITSPAQQQVPANVTPVNANQAQGAPVPADTVTLANQAAEGQQTGTNPNPHRFDPAAFLGGAGAYFLANNQANGQPDEPTLPVPLTQNQAQNQAPNPAQNQTQNTAATNTAAAATSNAGSGAITTPQQELQQLDQSLQRLGINPQTIPLFNRMAMLLYANDPAALRLLVETLQSAAQQGAAQNAAAPAANSNQAAVQQPQPTAQPSQAQAAQPQQAATPNQGQAAQPQGQTGQGPEQIDVLAAQFNFISLQAGSQPTQAGTNQPAANAASAQPGQPSALTVQIEELQVAFQALEVQPSPPQLTGAPGPTPPGNALNVTA